MVAHDAELLPRRLGRNEEGQLAEPERGRGNHARRDRRLLSVRVLSIRGRRRALLAARQALPCGRSGGMTTTNTGGGARGAPPAPSAKGEKGYTVYNSPRLAK